MFCVHCGTEVPDVAKFCSGCGKVTVVQDAPAPDTDKPAAVEAEKPVGVEAPAAEAGTPDPQAEPPTPPPPEPTEDPEPEKPEPTEDPEPGTRNSEPEVPATATPAPVRKSRAGLKIFVALMLMAVMGGAGFGGWYFYDQARKKDLAAWGAASGAVKASPGDYDAQMRAVEKYLADYPRGRKADDAQKLQVVIRGRERARAEFDELVPKVKAEADPVKALSMLRDFRAAHPEVDFQTELATALTVATDRAARQEWASLVKNWSAASSDLSGWKQRLSLIDRFLSDYSGSSREADARGRRSQAAGRIDSLEWSLAEDSALKALGDVTKVKQAYQSYLGAHPKGRHSAEAREILAAIESEPIEARAAPLLKGTETFGSSAVRDLYAVALTDLAAGKSAEAVSSLRTALKDAGTADQKDKLRDLLKYALVQAVNRARRDREWRESARIARAAARQFPDSKRLKLMLDYAEREDIIVLARRAYERGLELEASGRPGEAAELFKLARPKLNEYYAALAAGKIEGCRSKAFEAACSRARAAAAAKKWPEFVSALLACEKHRPGSRVTVALLGASASEAVKALRDASAKLDRSPGSSTAADLAYLAYLAAMSKQRSSEHHDALIEAVKLGSAEAACRMIEIGAWNQTRELPLQGPILSKWRGSNARPVEGEGTLGQIYGILYANWATRQPNRYLSQVLERTGRARADLTAAELKGINPLSEAAWLYHKFHPRDRNKAAGYQRRLLAELTPAHLADPDPLIATDRGSTLIESAGEKNGVKLSEARVRELLLAAVGKCRQAGQKRSLAVLLYWLASRTDAKKASAAEVQQAAGYYAESARLRVNTGNPDAQRACLRSRTYLLGGKDPEIAKAYAAAAAEHKAAGRDTAAGQFFSDRGYRLRRKLQAYAKLKAARKPAVKPATSWSEVEAAYGKGVELLRASSLRAKRAVALYWRSYALEMMAEHPASAVAAGLERTKEQLCRDGARFAGEAAETFAATGDVRSQVNSLRRQAACLIKAGDKGPASEAARILRRAERLCALEVIADSASSPHLPFGKISSDLLKRQTKCLKSLAELESGGTDLGAAKVRLFSAAAAAYAEWGEVRAESDMIYEKAKALEPKNYGLKAAELFSAAEGRCAARKNESGRAYLMGRRALSLGFPFGNPKANAAEAAKLYVQAAAICARLGDGYGEAQLLESRRWLFSSWVNPKTTPGQAAEAAGRAAAAFARIGRKKDQARMLSSQAGSTKKNINPKGSWSEACRLYSRAADIYASIGEEDDQAQNIYQWAGCMKKSRNPAGSWDKAIALYRRAAEIRARTGKKSSQASCISEQAYCHRKNINPAGSWSKAASLYGRSAALYAEASYRSSQARALESQAYCTTQDTSLRGKETQAAKVYARAAALWAELKSYKNQGWSLHQQAGCLEKDENPAGSWDRAARLYAQAAALRAKGKSKSGQAQSLYQQGWCMQKNHNSRGSWETAIKLYGQAAELYRQAGMKSSQAVSLKQQAFCNRKDKNYKGSWEQAIKLYGQAADLYRQVKNKAEQASALENKAWCYQEGKNPRGSWRESYKLYVQAGKLYRAVGNKNRLAFCIHQQAFAGSPKQGAMLTNSQAAKLYAEAVSVRRGTTDRKGLATSLYNQASCMQKDTNSSGSWYTAETLYREAGQIAEKAGERKLHADSVRGRAYCVKKQSTTRTSREKAARLYEEAAGLYAKVYDRKQQGRCLHQQAWLLEKANPTSTTYGRVAKIYGQAAQLRKKGYDKPGYAYSLYQQAWCLVEGKGSKARYNSAARKLFKEAADVFRRYNRKDDLRKAESWLK
jgi:Soluble NSF attachment protein, SNAP/zinc-ribbon domain